MNNKNIQYLVPVFFVSIIQFFILPIYRYENPLLWIWNMWFTKIYFLFSFFYEESILYYKYINLFISYIKRCKISADTLPKTINVIFHISSFKSFFWFFLENAFLVSRHFPNRSHRTLKCVEFSLSDGISLDTFLRFPIVFLINLKI